MNVTRTTDVLLAIKKYVVAFIVIILVVIFCAGFFAKGYLPISDSVSANLLVSDSPAIPLITTPAAAAAGVTVSVPSPPATLTSVSAWDYITALQSAQPPLTIEPAPFSSTSMFASSALVQALISTGFATALHQNSVIPASVSLTLSVSVSAPSTVSMVMTGPAGTDLTDVLTNVVNYAPTYLANYLKGRIEGVGKSASAANTSYGQAADDALSQLNDFITANQNATLSFSQLTQFTSLAGNYVSAAQRQVLYAGLVTDCANFAASNLTPSVTDSNITSPSNRTSLFVIIVVFGAIVAVILASFCVYVIDMFSKAFRMARDQNA